MSAECEECGSDMICHRGEMKCEWCAMNKLLDLRDAQLAKCRTAMQEAIEVLTSDKTRQVYMLSGAAGLISVMHQVADKLNDAKATT